MPSKSYLAPAVLLTAAVALTGCGSLKESELPGPAEPPRSPPLTKKPAGTLQTFGRKIEGIAVDSGTGTLALPLINPSELLFVSGDSGKTLGKLKVDGKPRHMALTSTTAQRAGRFALPIEDTNRLLEVPSPVGGKVPKQSETVSTPTAKQPHDAAILPNGDVAVGAELGNKLQLVRDGKVIAQANTSLQPGGVVDFGEGRYIGVVTVKSRRFEVYSSNGLKRLGSLPAGVGPTHVACLERGTCYVLDTAGDGMLVFQFRQGKLEQTRRVWIPGGPYGIALDSRRRNLWITSPKLNQLTLISANDFPGRRGERIPTVRQPNTVAVDHGTGLVYVMGKVGGVLQRYAPAGAKPRSQPNSQK